MVAKKKTPAQAGAEASGDPRSSAVSSSAPGDESAAAPPQPEQAPVEREPFTGPGSPEFHRKTVEPSDDFKAKIAAMMSLVPYDAGEEHEPWDDMTEHKREVWRRAWQSSLDFAYVPELAETRIEDLDTDQQPQVLRRFVDGLGPKSPILNLVLAGNVGSGKTAAAVAAGNAAAERGLLARFVRHTQYVQMLRPEGSPVDLPDWQIRRRFRAPDLLILDDLGAGLDPDREASRFVVDETLGLIGDRISAGRATIVTTNEKPEALSLMLTERVLSRLSEHGHVLTLLHADRRGRLSW